MQKRLKEIVIYILENGSGLEPEHRAQLEEMQAELSAAGLPLDAVEEVIRQVLDLGVGRGIQTHLGLCHRFKGGAPLSPEAEEYLQRLLGMGLIDPMQCEEILHRARRLRPEGPGLEDVQFLAASLIFDENIGFFWGWDGDNLDAPRNLH